MWAFHQAGTRPMSMRFGIGGSPWLDSLRPRNPSPEGRPLARLVAVERGASLAPVTIPNWSIARNPDHYGCDAADQQVDQLPDGSRFVTVQNGLKVIVPRVHGYARHHGIPPDLGVLGVYAWRTADGSVVVTLPEATEEDRDTIKRAIADLQRAERISHIVAEIAERGTRRG